MPQSLSKMICHIVFSTKNRENLIPADQLEHLHRYIAECIRVVKGEAYRVGGTENHVHVACSLPRTVTAAMLLEEIKRPSSKWMKQFDPNFHWQDGYGIFSISQSHLDQLVRYIDNQKVHHKELDFKDELRGICDRYGVSYDEAYLWS